MNNITGTPLTSIHLIGHSFGAQTAGFAGKHCHGQLGHITGLDPAGPNFWSASPEQKLWRTDAQFVDVIHTNAEPLIPEAGYGLNQTLGHLDFWPNGGGNQPGCDHSVVQNVIFHNCDHQRSVWLYLDTIRQDPPPSQGVHCESYGRFVSGQCVDCDGRLGGSSSGCAQMGYYATEWRDRMIEEGRFNGSDHGGRFFLTTASETPFYGEQVLVLNGQDLTHLLFFNQEINTL